MRSNHYQKGLGLIELMIALVLSSLLMLGVTRMFADSVSSSSSETALAQVQDSARIAMEIIKKDVRMAGFQGNCVAPNSQLAPNSILNFQTQSVFGEEGNGTNSDFFTIVTAGELSAPDNYLNPGAGSSLVRVLDFNQSSAPGNTNVDLDRQMCFSSTDIFMVTDCRQTAIFSPEDEGADCKTDPTTITPDNNMNPLGVGGASVSLKDFVIADGCIESDVSTHDKCPVLYKVGTIANQGTRYSIDTLKDATDTNIPGPDGQPVFALFRDGVQMVDGVENLQVLYGITRGASTRYVSGCASGTVAAGTCIPGCTAAEVSTGNCNPGAITHIKISLLIASSSPVAKTTATDTFPIQNLNAANDELVIQNNNDRRLRRVFTSTIQLRNSG
ncbi:PilW family protein [Endozoicomonas numazuensis]|uniref:Pilus assembly protein PilW n=1 Tax=Endozoicomonas numazuensis TaxID=1137799 RepID=A0A081N989_9GAMM|nr:PilW family protein [Endozoicomonas numazuensis]KEQ15012.1 hypothetical protein GZ78_24315 [Endozoicomonas numazuensis]